MSGTQFERTEMLLGTEAVERLAHSHVAVFGLGGVGGHAVEALVRSGVGELTLVDSDTVSESNLNRQIFALRSTVGMRKTDAAARRIAEINPDCVLHLLPVFVLPENLEEMDFSGFDYVIDAIDTTSAKLALARICHERGIPEIAAMGAGNKLDPTRFTVCDIYETNTCPLAAVMRRELKRLGVPHLKVVFSPEPPQKPHFQPASEADEDPGEAGKRKKTVPASCAFVPSAAGLILAGQVIRDLAGV